MIGAATATMSERTRSCSGRVLCSSANHCRLFEASFFSMPRKSRRRTGSGGHAAGGSRQREFDRLAGLLGAAGSQLGGEGLIPEGLPHRGDETVVQSHLDRRGRHADGVEKTGAGAEQTRSLGGVPFGAGDGRQSLEALGGDALVAALLRERETISEEPRRLCEVATPEKGDAAEVREGDRHAPRVT